MSQRPSLVLEVLPHGEGLPLPAYATAGAAGLDLRAALDVPLVVRLAGTNVDLGKTILAESGLTIINADSMKDGAQKAVAAAKV